MKRELYDELMQSVAEDLKELSAIEVSGSPVVGAQESVAERRKQLEAQLLAFRFLPAREFAEEDHIVATSVVELEQLGERPMKFWVLIVPQLGGWVSTYQGKPLQILTVSSPLGSALLGKKKGEEFSLDTYRNEVRKYRILSHF